MVRQLSFYQILIILSIVGAVFIPHFGFAQLDTPDIKIPTTFDEAKVQFIGALDILKQNLWGALINVWEEMILPLWTKLYYAVKWFLDTYIRPAGEFLFLEAEKFFKPKIEWGWQKMMELLGERKPIIEEEFQKEKEEMTKDIEKEVGERIPEVTPKTIWDRLWDLIR